MTGFSEGVLNFLDKVFTEDPIGRSAKRAGRNSVRFGGIAIWRVSRDSPGSREQISIV